VFIWNFSTSQQLRDKLRDVVSETPIAIRVFWMFWATTTFSKSIFGKIKIISDESVPRAGKEKTFGREILENVD
jgi:hypothetical protein